MNPLPLPDSIEFYSLRGKRSGGAANQDSHCH